ncbi:hypothetical protein [Argonema galeatum]|uniref:hypothetical protein n=1 Tax=Argonema galeatum TaxID=2942762 RepID=UPI0020123EDA|nr:hypothetical protein [Argonema galeatum]MCL1467218.1 hypothetical protein [Argonema galeatum A003/A1]
MTKLLYPTLDLFLYHLNPEKFLANLPDKLQTILSPSLLGDKPDYLPLLPPAGYNDQFYPFDSVCQIGGYSVDGYYYPVQLGDTYALLFDCSVDCDLNYFQQLKKLATQKADLGQTWILSGYLDSPKDNPDFIAQLAYKAFLGKEDQQQPKRSKFLDATVFEIGQAPQDWQDLSETNHIVIIIYPTEEHYKQNALNFYDSWMRLFCYRHKIIWAYRETRQLKKQLAEDFQTSVKELQNLPQQTNLTKLRAALERCNQTLSNYANNLNYLRMRQAVIEVNLHNYRETLDDITEKASQFDSETNLTSFREFANLVSQKYQKQIEKDYSSFSPGLGVLENITNNIRGIVEIEQVESDRAFQETVEQWGIGIGVAAIAATSISPFVPNITKNESTDPLPAAEAGINFLFTFLFSILLGIFAKWIAKRLIKSRRPPKP